MCIRMYVCMYVCKYVMLCMLCVYVFIPVCMYVGIHVMYYVNVNLKKIDTVTSICMYVCMYVCMYANNSIYKKNERKYLYV